VVSSGQACLPACLPACLHIRQASALAGPDCLPACPVGGRTYPHRYRLCWKGSDLVYVDARQAYRHIRRSQRPAIQDQVCWPAPISGGRRYSAGVFPAPIVSAFPEFGSRGWQLGIPSMITRQVSKIEPCRLSAPWPSPWPHPGRHPARRHPGCFAAPCRSSPPWPFAAPWLSPPCRSSPPWPSAAPYRLSPPWYFAAPCPPCSLAGMPGPVLVLRIGR
jgi:hypothetical protein